MADPLAALSVGAVPTPEKWARFAVETHGLLDEWLAGKTVLDPTMGEGSLLSALADLALERGKRVSELPFASLHGVELNSALYEKALARFQQKYGVDMSAAFVNTDILTWNEQRCDLLFGNPPWSNFVDLPSEYQLRVKPFFAYYDLIPGRRQTLLGASRVDIAALVIQKTMIENLSPGGRAVFFVPLSLFLNDGAHDCFRRFAARGTRYFLTALHDFRGISVFPHIAARCGLAAFSRKAPPAARVPCFCFEGGAWQRYTALRPKGGGAFRVVSPEKEPLSPPRIAVPEGTRPRQGVNPCGAAAVFIFKEYEEIDEQTCKVGGAFLLPRAYVYPLICGQNFCGGEKRPVKWVLLPYNRRTGKPLPPAEMEAEPLLRAYLAPHRERLSARKGAFLQAYIKRGLWWALFGVGAYNFAPYKVVWEAYGRRNFRPRIFTGDWQANQSLQAFIPCADEGAALRLTAALSDPRVEAYLHSSRMEGTMNWAQPGKIAPLLCPEAHGF
ncbi:MAG: hypothetical protein LBR16_04865 [Treponema sp.]|jgi:hypothetical protein|nr:hypothetical protein [Treponema sp.]